jgi:hypothetical protein
MYYVYKHIRPDTNECFYIGRGSKRRAWTLFGGRAPYFKKYIEELRKLGLRPIIEIIQDNLTEDEAIHLEKMLVENTPGLINKLPGGVNSVRGLKWTEEQKIAARKPKPPGFGNKISKSLHGYKQTDEHRQAIRDGMRKGNRQAEQSARAKAQWEARKRQQGTLLRREDDV